MPEAPPAHEAHARISATCEASFILESREGPRRLARFSIVGFAPAGTITVDQDAIHVTGALPQPSRDQDPIEYLRRVQAFYHVDDHATPFVGGLVGSIGHDAIKLIEPTLEDGQAEPWPRLCFGLYLDALVYDHMEGTTTYVSRGEDRSQQLGQLLAQETTRTAPRVGTLDSPVDDTTFIQRVQQAQDEIARGEAFQIVLSRPFKAQFEGDLGAIYRRLRETEAVPYLYHLRFPERQLLGASPEMLVRVRAETAETFPIAGTRPVTGDAATDDAAGQEMASDRKETAEHAMLVDLARNDLNRVCKAGSVAVVAYQEVHRFHRVQHLVSHVRGQLDAHRDAWDALAAVFPAGTLSGAPKIRALEHIHRLEARARGPYGGAVAYASFNGDFDSAICIRSLSAQDGTMTVQAGAGITHRSDPQAEADETRHKARALLEALESFQEAA